VREQFNTGLLEEAKRTVFAMSASEGRRMSLKEISRMHFTTPTSKQSTPASSPKAKRITTPGQRRASTSTAMESWQTVNKVSSGASAFRRRASVASGVTPGRMGSAPTPPVTAYSSRMVDKLQLRCDELEEELETIRKESAKREEGLRQMLRESKVDVKALGVTLKQKDLQLQELNKELERARSKVLETEMAEVANDENQDRLRRDLERSNDRVASLERDLANRRDSDRAALFEMKKEKEQVLIESREQELQHLKALDAVKQEVNDGVRREMEARDEADSRAREIREKDAAIQRLQQDLAQEREHSSTLEQDLELAEMNLEQINQSLRLVSQQQSAGKDLVQQSKELRDAKAAAELARREHREVDAALAKERFFHAEDLSAMVVERACHRELAQHNQQRILGVLRAMRTGISVAQTRLDDYVQAKA